MFGTLPVSPMRSTILSVMSVLMFTIKILSVTVCMSVLLSLITVLSVLLLYFSLIMIWLQFLWPYILSTFSVLTPCSSGAAFHAAQVPTDELKMFQYDW